MRISGLVILIEGDQIAAAPINLEPVELAERLRALARVLVENPEAAECLAALHEHVPGSCARRSEGPPA